jgi:hypothetical protein
MAIFLNPWFRSIILEDDSKYSSTKELSILLSVFWPLGLLGIGLIKLWEAMVIITQAVYSWGDQLLKWRESCKKKLR